MAEKGTGAQDRVPLTLDSIPASMATSVKEFVSELRNAGHRVFPRDVYADALSWFAETARQRSGAVFVAPPKGGRRQVVWIDTHLVETVRKEAEQARVSVVAYGLTAVTAYLAEASEERVVFWESRNGKPPA